MYTGVVDTDDGDRYRATVLSVVRSSSVEDTSGPPDEPFTTWDNLQATLADNAEEMWPATAVPRGLILHALQDAMESHLPLGDTPNAWSPLGDTAPDNFEQFVDDANRFGADGDRGLSARILAAADGETALRFDLGDLPFSALAFYGDAFVTAVPSGAIALTIAASDRQHHHAENVWSVLDAAVPDGSRFELIIWRVYSGEGSSTRDVVTEAWRGVHRLPLRALGGALLVVGRIVRIRATMLNTASSDPTAPGRLLRAEAADTETAEACLELRYARRRIPKAIVAIHGTMSTAMRLAAALRRWSPIGTHIFRFEHDTWDPLERNVEDLVDAIQRKVDESVLLVAHSRGGLVAARAAVKLSGDSEVAVAGLVTLGTPFAGTPVAVAADVGLLGVRALMGGLRFLGGPVVDATTRIIGLALLARVPHGIAVMYPSDNLLPAIRDSLPNTLAAVAGVSDERAGDRYGLGVKFASGTFRELANDLVVSRVSALGGRADGLQLVVDSDHYSYLENAEVEKLIRQQISAFRLS